jgi:oryzin
MCVTGISLGGRYSTILHKATAVAATRGITVSVAAGNKNVNVSKCSPATENKAVTVTDIGSDEGKAYFSNWGAGVDVFAAGV